MSRSLLAFLRQHPWQRRLLTALLAVTLGVLIAMLAIPRIQTHLLLRDLGSGDVHTRQKAILRAVAMGRARPQTVSRLERALKDADDAKFSAVVTALRNLGVSEGRIEPAYSDRMTSIELPITESASTRAVQLWQMIAARRDNVYVRKTLQAAIADPTAQVRSLSAVLAARLADDAALAILLTDKDQAVAGSAALDAGIAGRTALVGAIRDLLLRKQSAGAETHCGLPARKPPTEAGGSPRRSETMPTAGTATATASAPPATGPQSAPAIDALSGAAFALATLAPRENSSLLTQLLQDADEPILRDRLIHVMTLLNTPQAAAAVESQLAAFKEDEYPPAMLLAACGKLKVSSAGPAVRKVLAAAAARNPTVTIAQALAAIQSADALHLDVRAETIALCRNLWTGDERYMLMLSAAARLLGHQAKDDEDAEIIDLLQQLARYEGPAIQSATAAYSPATPVPSAAAAVALWELRWPQAEELLRLCAGGDDFHAGDYIAWHLSRSSRADEAFALGLKMLPPPGAPPELRVRNDRERTAGAMLLALSAGSDQQKQQAVERITPRLTGSEDEVLIKGSYRCALLILQAKMGHLSSASNDNASLAQVADLAEADTPLRQRALMALLCAADTHALEWLLWNASRSPQELADLLLRGCGEVLAAMHPSLPAIDPTADWPLMFWQVRILQDTYAIRNGAGVQPACSAGVPPACGAGVSPACGAGVSPAEVWKPPAEAVWKPPAEAGGGAGNMPAPQIHAP